MIPHVQDGPRATTPPNIQVPAAPAPDSPPRVSQQRLGALAPVRSSGSLTLDRILAHIVPSTEMTLDSFGARLSAGKAIEALRHAFPDLSATVTATFSDPARRRDVLQLDLKGTYLADLGWLRHTGKKVDGAQLFLIADWAADGHVQHVSVRAEPGLLLHQLGYIADPRTKLGRLRTIARKSPSQAVKIGVSALWSTVKRFFAPKEPVPVTRFVPDPNVHSALDAVRRHFDAEKNGSVRATLETMSQEGAFKVLTGTKEYYGSREALYRHYVEVFAAFAGGKFEPTELIEGKDGRVYVEYAFEGIHSGELGGVPATGKCVRYSAQMIFEVAADLSVRSETSYVGALPVLAALALSDDPATEAGLRRLTA